MEFTKPQKFSARVSDKYFVSDNERFLYVKFELVLPDRIVFHAGQYLSLKVSELGERRSYSIASTPDDNHGFHLLVEIVPGGKGSGYLLSLKPGDQVEVLGPLGQFVIDPITEAKKKLFVATGSGVVPIYSMINDLLINRKETSQIRLHWGMRSQQDLFFVDNFARLEENYPNFVFDIVLSKPGENWELCSGYVQDCLSRDFAERKLSGWEAYVCGSPSKTESIAETLENLGIIKQNIHHEKFI